MCCQELGAPPPPKPLACAPLNRPPPAHRHPGTAQRHRGARAPPPPTISESPAACPPLARYARHPPARDGGQSAEGRREARGHLPPRVAARAAAPQRAAAPERRGAARTSPGRAPRRAGGWLPLWAQGVWAWGCVGQRAGSGLQRVLAPFASRPPARPPNRARPSPPFPAARAAWPRTPSPWTCCSSPPRPTTASGSSARRRSAGAGQQRRGAWWR